MDEALSPKKAGGFRHEFLRVWICFFGFGGSFAVGTLGILKTQMVEYLEIDDSQFGYLFAITSVPSIFIALFSGYILDTFGLRWCTLGFAGAVFLAATGVALGTYFRSYDAILAFRIVGGFGELPIIIAQNAIMSECYHSDYLPQTVAMAVTLQRLAMLLSFLMATGLVNWAAHGFIWALVVGAAGAGVTLFGASVFTLLYGGRGGTKVNVGAQTTESSLQRAGSAASLKPVIADRLSHTCKIRECPNPVEIFWYPFKFWCLCAALALIYGIYYPLMSVLGDVLQTEHHYSPIDSGLISSIITAEAMIITPLVGVLVGRIGRRAILTCVGVSLFPVAFALKAFTSITPIVPVVLVGLAVSIPSPCVWSAVPLIFPHKTKFGTQFGVVTTVQQTSMFLTNMAIGYIKKHHGYKYVMIYLLCMGIAASLASFALLIVDWSGDGRVNAAPQKRLEVEDVYRRLSGNVSPVESMSDEEVITICQQQNSPR